MIGGLCRVLFGFIVACLLAGAATVAFVITPADIATLPAALRPDRMSSAGTLSLLAATHSAIFAAPFALIALIIAEWRCIRSWVYYATVGILIAFAGFGAEYLNEVGGQPSIVNSYAMRAYLAVGFLGGIAYWLAAGRRSGGKRGDEHAARRRRLSPDPTGEEKTTAA
ncbi:MAG: hypothetical protein ACXWJ2_05285 [Hyphomicrobium sp.]